MLYSPVNMFEMLKGHMRHPSSHIYYALLAILLIVFVVFFWGRDRWFLYSTDTAAKYHISETNDDFTLVASYLGDEQWKYTITGNIPNPCINHKSTLEQVAESDKINLKLFLYRYEDESLCAQDPQVIKEDGKFSAPRATRISFNVDERIQKASPTGLKPKKL